MVVSFQAIDNFVDLYTSVQTPCDIIVNPHLYTDVEEIIKLIEEKWNRDGDTCLRHLGKFQKFRYYCVSSRPEKRPAPIV